MVEINDVIPASDNYEDGEGSGSDNTHVEYNNCLVSGACVCVFVCGFKVLEVLVFEPLRLWIWVETEAWVGDRTEARIEARIEDWTLVWM